MVAATSYVRFRNFRPSSVALKKPLFRSLGLICAVAVILGAPGWNCTILGRLVGGRVAGLRLRRALFPVVVSKPINSSSGSADADSPRRGCTRNHGHPLLSDVSDNTVEEDSFRVSA